MNLIYMRDKYEILDTIYALYFAYNCNYKELIESYNLKVNEEILKDLNELSYTLDKSKKSLELFLDKDFTFKSLPFSMHELFSLHSSHEIGDLLKKLDMEYIKFKVLYTLYFEHFEENSNARTYIESLMKDTSKLFKFVDSLPISLTLKWKLYEFMINPTEYFLEFKSILDEFLPLYNKIIEKHRLRVEKFNNHMESRIKDKDIEFLKDINKDISNLNDYKEVYITTSLFSSLGVNFEIESDTIYLCIGIDCEILLNQRSKKELLDEHLSILKVLSEPVKYEILNHLSCEDLFGKEIASKTNLSKNTISHHMNNLISLNLVKLTKDGTKIYYSLNKNVVIDALDYIRQEFNNIN